jgi:hypothetical protein
MTNKLRFGIYHMFEKILRESDRPLTCVDLYDYPEVKKLAEDANQVSDYLGHMYRRKFLRRHPAPNVPGSNARYAYSWRDEQVANTIENRNMQPRYQVPVHGEVPKLRVVDHLGGPERKDAPVRERVVTSREREPAGAVRRDVRISQSPDKIRVELEHMIVTVHRDFTLTVEHI